MKVLFVCRQNIGRSQIAEALYNKYSKSQDAFSAGTVVDSEGQTIIDAGAINVPILLREEKIDPTNLCRNLVTVEMIDRADRVIVMTEPSTTPEWLKRSEKYEYWDIYDPVVSDLAETRVIFQQLKDKVVSLLQGT